MERLNDYCCTGWTPTVKVKPASKEQLIALRDLLLEEGHKNAAAALDNAIDLIVNRNVGESPSLPEQIIAEELTADYNKEPCTALPHNPRTQFTAAVEYDEGCGYDADLPAFAIGR